MSIDQLTDREVIALTLWGEARSLNVEGRVAVASVIANRVRDGRYGNGWRGVCLRKAQFSCWFPKGGLKNYQMMMERVDVLTAKTPPTILDSALRECLWIADGLMAKAVQDRVYGATHYYHESIPAPKWAQGKSPVTKVEGHLFFVNVD